MSSTVILTGANGSLAIPSVKYLLAKYPDLTLVLTVRSTSDDNTKRLQEVISHSPKSHTSIRTLDLSSLAAVENFAAEIKDDISSSKLPRLVSIICNAFTWSISGGLKFTIGGYESSLAVNHLARLSLVLRLLDQFGPDGGRITFLSSDAYYPGRNGLEKYQPTLPNDLDLLAHPKPDVPGQEVDSGFQRYALSKVAIVMGMLELNHKLANDPELKNITSLALDPGGLTDSRVMKKGVPLIWTYLMKGFLNPLQPLLKYAIPTFRSTNVAAVDLVELSVGKAYDGATGNYVMLKHEDPSPESGDAEKRKKLWAKSVEWARISADQTALKVAV